MSSRETHREPSRLPMCGNSLCSFPLRPSSASASSPQQSDWSLAADGFGIGRFLITLYTNSFYPKFYKKSFLFEFLYNSPAFFSLHYLARKPREFYK